MNIFFDLKNNTRLFILSLSLVYFGTSSAVIPKALTKNTLLQFFSSPENKREFGGILKAVGILSGGWTTIKLLKFLDKTIPSAKNGTTAGKVLHNTPGILAMNAILLGLCQKKYNNFYLNEFLHGLIISTAFAAGVSHHNVTAKMPISANKKELAKIILSAISTYNCHNYQLTAGICELSALILGKLDTQETSTIEEEEEEEDTDDEEDDGDKNYDKE